jgi:mannose-1-phosphate guanylyltransferase
MFKASVILKELKKYSPKVVEFCEKSLEDDNIDLEFKRLNKDWFKKCENISIDKAVMEKTNLGCMIPLDVGWSDVGSWSSIWDISHKNSFGNVNIGNVKSIDSRNNYLRSENRLVVGIGLENLIIVETNDAILVANKESIQKVKDIVMQLKKEGKNEGIYHRKIYRPWGHYVSVVEGYRWQVKRIEVKPGASLSLQMHHHRTEHWIVVTGTAEVEIDSKLQIIGENKSISIPLGSTHRLSNPGKIPLILIEVQSGPYLKEDDIVRIKDKYGRTKQ